MKAISAAAFTAGGRTRMALSSTTPRDLTSSYIHDSVQQHIIQACHDQYHVLPLVFVQPGLWCQNCYFKGLCFLYIVFK